MIINIETDDIRFNTTRDLANEAYAANNANKAYGIPIPDYFEACKIGAKLKFLWEAKCNGDLEDMEQAYAENKYNALEDQLQDEGLAQADIDTKLEDKYDEFREDFDYSVNLLQELNTLLPQFNGKLSYNGYGAIFIDGGTSSNETVVLYGASYFIPEGYEDHYDCLVDWVFED